ncbi:MAG: hypothetical protein WCT04_05230 [Planctomycetota bacterium]
MRQIASLLLVAFLVCGCARSDDDVAGLLKDAKATLAAHRDSQGKAAEYAQCIYNLEKAQVLLEQKGDSSSSLAQEVNSTLFWAKRFSNVEIANEVAKLRTVGGLPKATAKTAPVEKPAAKGEFADSAITIKAKAAYEEAVKFASSKSADPFAVSLRWFQVASQFSGTDYSLKALENARQAQAQVAAGTPAVAPVTDATAPAAKAPQQSVLTLEIEELKTDKPEYVLIREGEKLAASKKFEEAIVQYKCAIAIRDTIPAQRRMGRAHFELAQKLNEALEPKYIAMDKELAAAYQKAYELRGGNRVFNDRNPAWVAAQRKLTDLRKEADGPMLQAAAAQGCFDKIIRMSPGNKDFDAAAYSAVSMSRRPTLKLTARTYIKEFLKNYTPIDGTEQLTYEFCKSEYERLGH